MVIATVEAPRAELTAGDLRHLSMLEKRIDRGLNTFREVGAALIEIRDKQLYRSTHLTFEAYCRDRWGIERARAYQLMAASEVAQSLPEATRLVNESQARELAPLLHTDPALMSVVWQRVSEGDEPITGPRIRQVVRDATGATDGKVAGDGAPSTPTTMLLALIARTQAEHGKWRKTKPNIGERTKVKRALDALCGVDD